MASIDWIERVQAARAANPEAWEAADADQAGGDTASGSGAEPDRAVSAGLDDSAPRRVTRGAKLQDEGLRIGIKLDWYRGTGPVSRVDALQGFLVSRFGNPEERAGRFWYAFQLRWECGVQLLWGSAREAAGQEPGERDTCMVEVPGGVLTILDNGSGGKGAMDFVRTLQAFGLKCTRVDVAADFCLNESEEGSVGLVDTIRECCEARELCGAKRWEFRCPMSGSKLVGNSVHLGRRGDAGSGRYVRVYDKGLERQIAPPGRWERFEVEFSHECAEKVMDGLCELDEWWEAGWAFVMGAVDFRENTGERSLERRPRLAWWAGLMERVLDDLPAVTVRESREATSWGRWVEHFKRCVLPTVLGAAKRAGWSPEQTFSYLLEKAGPVKREVLERNRTILWEFEQEVDIRGVWVAGVTGTPF